MSLVVSEIASTTAAPVGARAGTTIERPQIGFVTDATEWNRLVMSAPMAHLPQCFAYGEGKGANGWTVRRATFAIGGQTIAIATVLERRVLGLRVLSRVNRGPVFLEASPAPETIVAVHSALRRRWRGPLLIAPALFAGPDSSAQLRAAGFRLRQEQGWLSGAIQLDRPEDEIWAGFTSAFRNRVRNAVKAGATLRVANDDTTYRWMLDRHTENKRDKGFSGANDALLLALRASAPGDVTVFQLMHGGLPVAGMSIVRFGRRAEYHIGWFGKQGRDLNAGNFLMWEIIKELRRRGVSEFDVGGLKPGDGYTRFKRTMNPAEYRLAGEWMSL